MSLKIVSESDTHYKSKADVIIKTDSLNPFSGIGACGVVGFIKSVLQAEVGHTYVGKNTITVEGKQVIFVKLPSLRNFSNNHGLYEEEIKKKLTLCYNNALQSALDLGCKCVYFPLVYDDYDYSRFLDFFQIGKESCLTFLLNNKIDIILAIPNHQMKNVEIVGKDYYKELKLYVDRKTAVFFGSEPFDCTLKKNIQKYIEVSHQSFFDTLSNLITQKETTEVEVYKKAQIDRRLFSKLRSNVDYIPSKNTVFAFAIALELDLDTTHNLLACAGYTLGSSSKFDMVVQYFIEHKKYDIHELNEMLFHFTNNTLSSRK